MTDSVNPSMEAGVEITLGIYKDDLTACELTYFGLHHWSDSASVVDVGRRLQAPFSNFGFYKDTFDFLNDFFDAHEQGVTYSSDLHNVELNVRRQLTSTITSICGLRYIDYDEEMHFYSIAANSDVGIYNVDVVNRMLGLQIGGDANYQLTDCLAIAGNAKTGMFINFIEQDTVLRNTAPDILIDGGNSATGLSGVIDVNLNGTYTHGCLELIAGYRVLLLSGMATAEAQFDFSINEDPDAVVRNVDHQGSVVLHGPFVGLTATY
jgi:hypothetical protein